ncbi:MULTISPECIES: response regulator [unclassified Streptomyces]|uniref:response regulator n=1 Tax=unclassified Streptomyces TaxID=2593676 RepID=UPI003826D357
MAVNVLLVDDDPGFRRMAEALLRARGMRVVAESADGASAIAAARAHRPDGVLLDVHLPDQDGMSVARALGAGQCPPRVVLTSTDRSPWSAEELAAAGVVAFVTKDLLYDTDLAALLSS